MKTNLKKAFLTTLATLGLGMLVFGSATTWAADMCFSDDYNRLLVGKNFSFPSAGACKAFNGYDLGTSCIVSGTACGTSNNADIRFSLDYDCTSPGFFGSFGTSAFYISRLYSNIEQAGYGYNCQPTSVLGSGACAQWSIKTVACPSSRPLN